MARKKPEPEAHETPRAVTNARREAIAKVAGEFTFFRPANKVLSIVRAVPTIFPQVDHATGVHGMPLERFGLIHGPSGEGKAQNVDAPVLTPSGWRRIGDLVIGDEVIAGDGTPTRVEGVYPQGSKPLYRVVMSDGIAVECCAEHLWFTTTNNERNRGRYTRGPRPERRRIKTGVDGAGSVKSLAVIMENFEPGEHAIPLVEPVQFRSLGELPIDPYLFGLMLGDGGLSGLMPMFHKPERDLQEQVAMRLPVGDSVTYLEDGTGVRVKGGELRRQFAKLDLWGCRSWEKFIPDLYLRASVEDRFALLRGLCDTDGSVVKDGGAIEYSTSSPKLAKAFVDLARSLGAYVTTEDRKTNYPYLGAIRAGRPSTRVRIYFPRGVVPIASKKNLKRWKGRGALSNYRTIERIEPSRHAEAVCIRVAHPSRLYVTEGYVVTHNTLFTLGLILSFLKAEGFAALIDAERTTSITWARGLMGDYADHPGFHAVRPDTYEDTIRGVREWLKTIVRLRETGKIPDDTPAIMICDSIRKLVPETQLKQIMASAGSKDAKDISRRAAQIKAAMNAGWMDELIPLLEKAGAAFFAIAREMQDPDANPFDKKFGQDFKVGGGGAIYYDASMVFRIERASYVAPKKTAEQEEKKTRMPVYGERHRVTVRKTKVSGREERQTVCFFHSSNGVFLPAGFDRARDVLELGEKFGLVKKSGSWLSFGKRRWQGDHTAVKKLTEDPTMLAELEEGVRAKFRTEAAVAIEEEED